jgi:hypothetical protein
MIEEIFSELGPYLRGIKRADNYSIAEVHLKQTWSVPTHDTIKNQNKAIQKIPGMVYYMFYSETDSFDDVLDWIKREVIEKNLEIEQKEELLKIKVTQLKEVFENSSLEELKKLSFSSESNVLKLGKTITEKKEVENVET